MATAEELATWKRQEAALEGAMRNGVSEVSYDGQTVKYRDLSEIRRALGELRRLISQAEGKPRARRYYFGTGRGY